MALNDTFLGSIFGSGFLMNNRFVLALIYASIAIPFTVYLLTNFFSSISKSYDLIEDKNTFYEVGLGFGSFQELLSDYKVEYLHETIKDFHNTSLRFDKFIRVLEKAPEKRSLLSKDEIDFVLKNKGLSEAFLDLERQEKLPKRVTHNDTKLIIY